MDAHDVVFFRDAGVPCCEIEAVVSANHGDLQLAAAKSGRWWCQWLQDGSCWIGAWMVLVALSDVARRGVIFFPL